MKHSSPPFLHVVGAEQPKPEKQDALAAQEPTAASPELSPLICDCVKFVQANAAHVAGWLADPSGNSDYAEPLGKSYWRARVRALARLTDAKRSTPTLPEMQALAAVTKILVAGNLDEASIDPRSTAFIRLFLRDTEAFLDRESERRRRLAEIEEEHDLTPTKF